MGVAYLVLVVTLVSTAIVVYRVHESIKANDQARFDRSVSQMQLGVKRRLARCVDQMYDVRALFAASDNVNMSEWQVFFDTMNVRQSDLGIRTLGYLERVMPAEKDAFARRWNPDTKTNYSIIPEGDRPEYFPAVFTTHFDWKAVTIYGLDHGARPQRLEAIRRAIDENQPAVTARVKTVTAGGISTNVATFFYLAIYQNGSSVTNVEQRRAATRGVIFMTIFPHKMLSLLAEDQDNLGVNSQIFDGEPTPENLFFDTDVAATNKVAVNPAISHKVIIPVYNRSWTILFSTTPAFDHASKRHLQWLALAAGLAISFLLFAIAWIQARARIRAEADEAALAIEKEELSVTLYSIGDGVITTDTDARVVSINKVAQILTGWTQKEAAGKAIDEVFRLFHEHDHTPAPTPIGTVLRTGEIVELGNHIMLVSRDGIKRSIADSAAPIRDRFGAVTGVVLVFRDVTEKQRLEAQLLKESKLESVGVLAGGIAHDFNNMLMCIAGNISLARMDGIAPEQKARMMKDAENAAIRARDLTQQLLTFAKGGEPVKKPMHLDDFVRETCEFALRGSNVQCEFSWNEDVAPVEVDEGQFRQVLNNLVLNARQSMPRGGRIKVTMENESLAKNVLPPLLAGDYVKISIIDHGSGITPELLPRIFEPYFTTKPGGSGLGLATAYSIVRKHNGTIKVASTLEVGSTFEIYLPVSDKRIAPLPRMADLNCWGDGRILIMDDDVSVLTILTAMLNKFGYEVETALDGAEAVKRYAHAKLNGKRFSIVIMDLTVPNGLGGRETIKQLRELDPDVKAIVSSGYSLDPVMAHYHEDGFAGIIPKPYRAEELARLLKEVVGSGN